MSKSLPSKAKRALYLMVYTDMSVTEIAEELKVSERTLYRYKSMDDFTKLKDEAERELLQSLRAKAIRTINELMDSKNDNVRFNASKDVMDRTGLKPTEAISYTTIPIIIGGEDELED